MVTRYPNRIGGIPCLHVLICKTALPQQRFQRMLANGIIAIDDVHSEQQESLAIDMTAFAAGLIAKTCRTLPYDFYHRFINKQYGKWGNEIGKLRRKQ